MLPAFKFLNLAIFLFAIIGCSSSEKEPWDEMMDEETMEENQIECISSNDSEVITNNCGYALCNFSIHKDSKIDPSVDDGFSEGDKIVFEVFLHTSGTNPDAEVLSSFLFEIEVDWIEFAFEGSSVAVLSPISRAICLCPYGSWEMVTNGCIRGTKLGDTSWMIEINSLIHSVLPFKVDAEFN